MAQTSSNNLCEIRVLLQHMGFLENLVKNWPRFIMKPDEITNTGRITIRDMTGINMDSFENTLIPLVRDKYPFTCRFPAQCNFVYGRFDSDITYNVCSEQIYSDVRPEPSWEHQYQRYCEHLTYQLLTAE